MDENVSSSSSDWMCARTRIAVAVAEAGRAPLRRQDLVEQDSTTAGWRR